MEEKREQGSRTPKELAAKVGDEPEEESERGADDETGHDGKVKGGVFAAMNDVSGQPSKAKWKFAAEVEESADEDEESAEEKKRAPEFAKRIHQIILPEPVNKLCQQSLLLLLITYP